MKEFVQCLQSNLASMPDALEPYFEFEGKCLSRGALVPPFKIPKHSSEKAGVPELAGHGTAKQKHPKPLASHRKNFSARGTGF